MNRKRWVILALLIIFLGVGIAWACGYIGPDRKLAEVQAMADDMGKAQTPEDRRAAWEKMGEKMKELSPDQRQKYFESMGKKFQEGMQKRVHDTLALKEPDRTAEIDRQIQEMEKRRKDFEKFRSQGGGPPGGRGPGGGGPGGGPGQAGGGPPGGGPSGGRGAGPGVPGVGRGGGLAGFLDHTSPVQRAEMAAYMQMMAARRQQLGLPPMHGPFGR